MKMNVFQCTLSAAFVLVYVVFCAAQPVEKSPGALLFDKGEFAAAIELLKKSNDLVDLNYLGHAYEKLGNEKEARNAFDRSFRLGYKEFADDIVGRSRSEPKQSSTSDKLSDYLDRNAKRIVVAAVSAEKTIKLKGPSYKDREWMPKAQMILEIGKALMSNEMVYARHELEVDSKVLTKPRVSYTQAARNNGTQGTVGLLVFFDRDGRTKAAIATNPLPDGLTEEALIAASKITFVPAQKNGKAVATLKTVTYSFSIY